MLAGLGEQIMNALNESGAVPHALLMIDRTFVRAHNQAAGAKGGLNDRVLAIRAVVSRRGSTYSLIQGLPMKCVARRVIGHCVPRREHGAQVPGS